MQQQAILLLFDAINIAQCDKYCFCDNIVKEKACNIHLFAIYSNTAQPY